MSKDHMIKTVSKLKISSRLAHQVFLNLDIEENMNDLKKEQMVRRNILKVAVMCSHFSTILITPCLEL